MFIMASKKIAKIEPIVETAKPVVVDDDCKFILVKNFEVHDAGFDGTRYSFKLFFDNLENAVDFYEEVCNNGDNEMWLYEKADGNRLRLLRGGLET